jgi:hypothetical protein
VLLWGEEVQRLALLSWRVPGLAGNLKPHGNHRSEAFAEPVFERSATRRELGYEDVGYRVSAITCNVL